MLKYGNKKIKVDGIIFDSHDEASYYLDLIDMKSKGIVKSFELQPKFILIPQHKKYNRKISAITYTPDFKVVYTNGQVEYIDIKGYETEASKLRKKMFDYFYPDLTLKWLEKNNAYGDEYGWITKEELKKIVARNKKNSYRKLKN